MTERQQEIKKYLDEGKGARQIAEIMGITRNAVYQQIQRMRNNGDLGHGYTPSGQPTREMPPSPGQRAVKDLAQELSYVRGELDRLTRRLDAFL